jgi:hypothetical protein
MSAILYKNIPSASRPKKETITVNKKDMIMISFAILTITLAIGGLHMAEHVAQVIQKFVLHMQPAHGLLGAKVDIEPIHFTYNILYLGLVALVWIMFRQHPMRELRLVYGLILAVLLIQTWHFVEHTIKIEQHFVNGCVSCPGLLGGFTDLAGLHFLYNIVVYLPLISAWLIFQYKVPSLLLTENKEITISDHGLLKRILSYR